MHKEFNESADKYYYHVRTLVERHLEGQGSNDTKFLGVAAYNFANPLYVAVGRHLLVLDQRVADNNGRIVTKRVPQVATSFVTVFGNACFEVQDLDQYIKKMYGSPSYIDTLADLREKPKFQSQQSSSSTKPYALVGCTFAKLDGETQDRLVKQLESRRESMKGLEVVPAGIKLTDTQFAPYGYAGIINRPSMFDRGITGKTVRFYGVGPNHLVLEDNQPIDVKIEDSKGTPTVEDICEYSLVKFDQNQGRSSRSDSVPYLGPLSLVNEIAFIKDANGYSPELIFQAIEKGLDLK